MNNRIKKRGPTAAVLVLLASVTVAYAGSWRPLANDGLHDNASPAIGVLQEPTNALSQLPPDTAGNKVNWIKALNDGYIQPRSALSGNKEVKILDSEVLMNLEGSTPIVRFPHKPHTQWLDCENCHEQLFKSKAGATPVTMGKILEGEYCGVCHGAVSFPLTECNRCHSVPRKKPVQGTATGGAPAEGR